MYIYIYIFIYTVNFEYNTPLSIIRIPNSGFYHNVKINRPMYKSKFEPRKLKKR